MNYRKGLAGVAVVAALALALALTGCGTSQTYNACTHVQQDEHLNAGNVSDYATAVAVLEREQPGNAVVTEAAKTLGEGIEAERSQDPLLLNGMDASLQDSDDSLQPYCQAVVYKGN